MSIRKKMETIQNMREIWGNVVELDLRPWQEDLVQYLHPTDRHEKSSKPSADDILGYLKFPQTETFKFPQNPTICDQKYLYFIF